MESEMRKEEPTQGQVIELAFATGCWAFGPWEEPYEMGLRGLRGAFICWPTFH